VRAARRSPKAPHNDLWFADFKGEFKLGNGRYRYPLRAAKVEFRNRD